MLECEGTVQHVHTWPLSSNGFDCLALSEPFPRHAWEHGWRTGDSTRCAHGADRPALDPQRAGVSFRGSRLVQHEFAQARSSSSYSTCCSPPSPLSAPSLQDPLTSDPACRQAGRSHQERPHRVSYARRPGLAQDGGSVPLWQQQLHTGMILAVQTPC